MRSLRPIALLLISAHCCFGQKAAATLLEKASAAYRKGDLDAALQFVEAQIKQAQEEADAYLIRGDIYSVRGDSGKAVESYSEVIKRNSSNSAALFRRGNENFRLGRVKDSVSDFDRLAELHPDRAAQLWQRGIASYYAGEFAKGRKQFEDHQKVNTQDVENAVWHFLCVAKLENFDKARAQLIPIQEDSRIPMAQIHKLFSGTGTPEEVLKAAEGNSDRMFYAHLYLGLYEEARGQREASLQHMKKAAGEFAQKEFMGDVARVHLMMREK
jgi:lipoprotein NlpI